MSLRDCSCAAAPRKISRRLKGRGEYELEVGTVAASNELAGPIDGKAVVDRTGLFEQPERLAGPPGVDFQPCDRQVSVGEQILVSNDAGLRPNQLKARGQGLVLNLTRKVQPAGCGEAIGERELAGRQLISERDDVRPVLHQRAQDFRSLAV